MNYKKKYEEALERAKVINPGTADYEVAVKIFPELKESEDERMWKLIKKYAHYNISDMALKADHITREQLETWLEKQGEQIDIANKEYWRGYREGKQEILDKYADLEKQSNTDNVIERAKTEKQHVIITETDGDANMDWNTRSLEDARKLLLCGLRFINTELEKQGETEG